MKLKTLKKMLNALPKEFDEKNVVMSRDAEGNGYSGLAQVDVTAMKRDGSHFEMVWNEDGETQPEPNTVILWPV